MTESQGAEILVVEDDPLLGPQLAQRAARQTAWQAHWCAEPAQAMAQIRRPQVKLVLLDLGLPPQADRPDEGLRLLSQWRQWRPDVPVLVMTGQDEAHCALQAIEAGAFDFLPKPIEPAAFDAALGRACRYASAWQRLAQQGAAPVQVDPQQVRAGLRETTDAAQERLLRQVLQACGDNVSQAARLLRLERTQLYYYLDKYGLRPSRDG